MRWPTIWLSASGAVSLAMRSRMDWRTPGLDIVGLRGARGAVSDERDAQQDQRGIHGKGRSHPVQSLFVHQPEGGRDQNLRLAQRPAGRDEVDQVEQVEGGRDAI